MTLGTQAQYTYIQNIRLYTLQYNMNVHIYLYVRNLNCSVIG